MIDRIQAEAAGPEEDPSWEGVSPEWMQELARQLAVRDDSDEVAQEAWARALANPAPRRVSARAWMIGIVRRVVVESRRGERARREREARYASDRGPRSILRGFSQECSEELGLALDDLPASLRETVELRFFEGLSVRETADRLGMTVAGTKSRLRRALDRLRERLGSHPGTPLGAWFAGAVARESSRLAPVPAAKATGAFVPSAVGGWAMAVTLLFAILGLGVLGWALVRGSTPESGTEAQAVVAVPAAEDHLATGGSPESLVEDAPLWSLAQGPREGLGTAVMEPVAAESTSSASGDRSDSSEPSAEKKDRAFTVRVNAPGLSTAEPAPVALLTFDPRAQVIWSGVTSRGGAIIDRETAAALPDAVAGPGVFAVINAPLEQSHARRVGEEELEEGEITLELPTETRTLEISAATATGLAPSRGTDVILRVAGEGGLSALAVKRWVGPGETLRVQHASLKPIRVQYLSGPEWGREVMDVPAAQAAGEVIAVHLVHRKARQRVSGLLRSADGRELPSALELRVGPAALSDVTGVRPRGPRVKTIRPDGTFEGRVMLALEPGEPVTVHATAAHEGVVQFSGEVDCGPFVPGEAIDLGVILLSPQAGGGSVAETSPDNAGQAQGFRGQVVVPEGVDPSTVFVEVWPVGHVGEGSMVTRLRAELDGVYRHDDCPPGTYELLYRAGQDGIELSRATVVVAVGGARASLSPVDLRVQLSDR